MNSWAWPLARDPRTAGNRGGRLSTEYRRDPVSVANLSL